MPLTIRPPTTFCGVPFAPELNRGDADVVVIGAPHGTPYRPGTPSHAAEAPAAIRQALGWYSTGTEQFDFDTMTPVFGGAHAVDGGDVAGSLTDGKANRAAIRAAVAAIRAGGAVPLVLGGDDSVPIPVIDAFSGRGPVTVVQVDAHIDWRHEIDGETHGFSSTMRRASELDCVERIVQIGARGPGSARASDLKDARDWGAHIVTAREVHGGGIAPALARIPKDAEIVLTIDVDGIDPGVVPGVILPAFGGLTYQQMLDVIHGTAARGRIVAVDFVEYVPARDPHGLGAQAIARLASNVIAAIARQRRGR